MASRIFIDAAYAARRLQGVAPDDVLLETAMESACRMIEQHLNRRILEASYTAIHSGSSAAPHRDHGNPSALCSAVLYLADPDSGLALANVSAITSLTEDGVSLTTVSVPGESQPYAAGSGAVLLSTPGKLLRAEIVSNGYGWSLQSWSPGYGNVRVVCTAGWPLASVPDDLKECAREMTWIVYKEGSRSGMDSLSDGGSAIQFIRTLPHLMQRTLDLYSLRYTPRTLAV